MWMQLSRTSYHLPIREKKNYLGMIAFTAPKKLKKEDRELQGSSLGLRCVIPRQKKSKLKN